MYKHRLFLFVLFLLCLSFSLAAWTADSGAPLKENRNYAFSFAPLVSVVTGYSNELVFDSSSEPYPYLSRLHWQILPAVTAGIKGSFNIRDRVFINAAIGTALNSYTGQMTDHDWLSDYFDFVSTEWTHESVSDIYLTSSLLLDSNGVFRFFNRKKWSFDGLIGYKHIMWNWTDTLVSLSYPDQDLDYLIGVNGIDYGVTYRIPYLGASYKFGSQKFTAGITLLYSFLVSVEDHDYHKLRGLHFYDSFSMGQYLGFSTSLRWRWTEVFSLSGTVDLDWVPELVGDAAVYDDSGTYLGTFNNGAGVSYLAGSVSLALEYNY